MTTNATFTDVGIELRYESPHIAVITIDSPPANSFSFESRASMMNALDIVEDNEEIRVLVMTGVGSTFTAGANLREDQELTDEDLKDYLDDFGGMLTRIENLRVPVIAAINGATVGGGLEFALVCDIRIASTDAFFVAAGVNVGLIVSFWRLPRVVGVGPAKEILLTGLRYPAEQALGWGLITEMHAPEDLMDAAMRKAQRIATRAPLSVEATKAATTRTFEMDYPEALALQTEKFVETFRSEDHPEALRAFFEKRDGNYKRR